jgi:hypothetical protein
MFGPKDSTNGDNERDGIITLVKETADGLGRLIADHIKLARTEIVADARSYGRDVGLLLAAVFGLGLGYALGCVAGALALAPLIGGPLAFAAVAGLNVVLGAVGAAAGVRALRRTRPMAGTMAEVSRSVTALSAASPPLVLHPTSLAESHAGKALQAQGQGQGQGQVQVKERSS